MSKLRILITIIAVLLLASCGKRVKQVPVRDVRTMCAYMTLHYPAATLQDVYKTCFQDFFGAEHMVRDTAAARAYLHQELELCTGHRLSNMPPCEPTGFRHRFMRVNLMNITEGKMTEDELLQQFLDAAGKDNAFSDNWAAEWQQIEKIALEVHPAWRDEALQELLRNAAQQNAAVHHSESFTNKYNPHYRIVKL